MRILAQSPNWRTREKVEIIQVMTAVRDLVELYTSEETFISDEIIESKLHDNYKLRTKIINENLLNHARAVWLNSKGAIIKRKEEIERRRQKKIAEEEASQRQKRKQEHKQKDNQVQRVSNQEQFCLMSFPYNTTNRIGCCNHGCKNERVQPHGDHDDGWRKCPIDICHYFFCPKISCQAFGMKHRLEALLQQINRFLSLTFVSVHVQFFAETTISGYQTLCYRGCS